MYDLDPFVLISILLVTLLFPTLADIPYLNLRDNFGLLAPIPGPDFYFLSVPSLFF
jgi:hypothetical protein